MNGYIKVSDLALIIIIIVVVALSVYVIQLIRNLNESLKVLRNILRDNKDNIDETLKNIPAISKNVAEITDTAKNELKMIESAIDSIGETAQLTAATAETVKNDIIGKLKLFINIVDFAKRIIDKFKKKEKKDKKGSSKDG